MCLFDGYAVLVFTEGFWFLCAGPTARKIRWDDSGPEKYLGLHGSELVRGRLV